MSDAQLGRRVARGLYERVGSGVFAVAGVAWTWERQARAALLGVGPLACLSHRAAAHLLGFEGFGECPVEVTVRRGRRARTELAIVHSTTHLHPLDAIHCRGLPVTSGARTVIDLCATGISEDLLGAAVGSSIRDGYTSEVFLRKRMASFRGCRGIRLLDLVLDGPIGHSYLERHFLRLVKAAGVPMPRTQVSFDGERVIRVDAVWEDAKLVVEVMGHRFHCTREELQRDAQRRNELQEMGYMVIELTALDLFRRPQHSIGRVRRNLAARRPSSST
jgi:hypothetical protein